MFPTLFYLFYRINRLYFWEFRNNFVLFIFLLFVTLWTSSKIVFKAIWKRLIFYLNKKLQLQYYKSFKFCNFRIKFGYFPTWRFLHILPNIDVGDMSMIFYRFGICFSSLPVPILIKDVSTLLKIKMDYITAGNNRYN